MVDRKITGLEVAGSSPVTITFCNPFIPLIAMYLVINHSFFKTYFHSGLVCVALVAVGFKVGCEGGIGSRSPMERLVDFGFVLHSIF